MEDDIHFEVDSDFGVRLYANDSQMLDVACSLCAQRKDCKGTGEGLMTPCSTPCG